MSIDHTTTIFLDASCLIAAAGSPTGRSGFLLSLCTRFLLRGVVSHVVLLEAERNIHAKLGATALQRYRTLLQTTTLLVAAIPTITGKEPWLEVINYKDAHVVAAALDTKAPYLITLDQKLVDEVNRAGLPIRALTAGDSIRSVLPGHADFLRLRS